MAEVKDVTEIAERARAYGFGITVMGRRVTLSKDRKPVYETTSWRLLNDWLDGFACGKESVK